MPMGVVECIEGRDEPGRTKTIVDGVFAFVFKATGQAERSIAGFNGVVAGERSKCLVLAGEIGVGRVVCGKRGGVIRCSNLIYDHFKSRIQAWDQR